LLVGTRTPVLAAVDRAEVTMADRDAFQAWMVEMPWWRQPTVLVSLTSGW
jgi:hypothetical protein